MHWERLKKSVGTRFELRPQPRITIREKLVDKDHDWTLLSVAHDRAVFRSEAFGYEATLGKDHIYSFTSNPARDKDGQKYGFLQLRVQIYFTDDSYRIDILPFGQWSGGSEIPEPKPHASKTPRTLPIQSAWPLVNGKRAPYLGVPIGGFGAPLFAFDFTHPDSQEDGEQAYELTFNWPSLDLGEFESILQAVHQFFQLGDHGSYKIEQTHMSWIGFGAMSLLRAISERDTRYSSHGQLDWHHSEDIDYFEKLDLGNLFFYARQRAFPEQRRLYSAELILSFPGLFVNPEPLKAFGAAIRKELPLVKPVALGFKRVALHRSPAFLEPMALVEDRGWVGGVIAKSPFRQGAKHIFGGDDDLQDLSRGDILVSDLGQHFPLTDIVSGLQIKALTRMLIGGRSVFHALGDWKSCLHDEDRGRKA